jgi:cobalt-zinc-cadmium efflux system outer membrane protein
MMNTANNERVRASFNHWANFLKFTLRLFILAAAVLSGCSTYSPIPVDPEQAANDFESRTLDSPDLRQFLEKNLRYRITPWPPRSWDMDMLTLAAFFYHPDLDVARAKWGVAQAGVITAGQHPNPRLDITPRYATNAADGVSPWILSSILDVPVETAGKRGYRISRARHLSEAARLNIFRTAWQVRSRLRLYYVELYALDRSEVILIRLEAAQEELVIGLGKRLAVGEMSQPDVTQADLSLDQIRLSLSEVRKRKAETRVQFADSLGLPVRALDSVEIQYTSLEKRPPDIPPPDVRH